MSHNKKLIKDKNVYKKRNKLSNKEQAVSNIFF